jgi:hypothetical protein
MKSEALAERKAAAVSEILILPDGKILAHNLSPAMAGILAELDPADETMRLRATQNTPHEIPD